MTSYEQSPWVRQKFVSNRVHTTKYTCLTFLPLNLMVQFSKMANVYFLIIMIMQFFPALANKHDWIFTLLPLLAVVGVSMVKDAFEDNKRRKKDNEENNATVYCCPKGTIHFEETKSQNI